MRGRSVAATGQDGLVSTPGTGAGVPVGAPASSQQLELLRSAARGKKPVLPPATAAHLPVARVIVDVPLPHLDRLFDYSVPEDLAVQAQPGVRVRVRFAGQDVEGFLAERVAATDHEGKLTPLRKVVSAEPVLAPEVLRLARAVAASFAGSVIDVLRLAVPARHARTEKEPVACERPRRPPPVLAPPSAGWGDYAAGPALISHISRGAAPRAVWTALPGPRWLHEVATAIEAATASGRGSLVVLPDGRDVAQLDAVLAERLRPGEHVRLEADLGPTARYRNFLALLRGDVQIAIGTRAAAFAPVQDLGLVVIWDDGDDLHAEPRAPYPHAREVLALRAELEGAALIAGGWSCSAQTAAWLSSGWARPVAAPRAALRTAWPRISVAGTEFGAQDDPSAHGRLPAPAWRALREGLTRGPVLVQVPRAGYVPGLSCQTCRKPARCTTCHGPLAVPSGEGAQLPECRWCGRVATAWSCPHCQGRRLRASSVGVARTAEELGRAFPGAALVVPRAQEATPAVPGRALVVSTPGLEPPVDGGYATAVLLDGGRLLERAQLAASQDALRHWLAACALVRPAPAGGLVVVCADPQAPAVQSLVRVDPVHFAERELAERTELGFPPAVVLAGLTGPAASVQALADAVALPPGTEVLGPIRREPAGAGSAGASAGTSAEEAEVQLLLRAPRGQALALARAVHAASAARSARREGGPVRVQIDPPNIG
jgi:primosomal protein N' (replication factor Y) (superfamily II helicase)